MKSFDMDVLSKKVSLTREEAAFFAGLGRDTLTKYIKRDEIPHFYVGRDLRVSRSGLEAWIETCAVERREI